MMLDSVAMSVEYLVLQPLKDCLSTFENEQYWGWGIQGQVV